MLGYFEEESTLKQLDEMFTILLHPQLHPSSYGPAWMEFRVKHFLDSF